MVKIMRLAPATAATFSTLVCRLADFPPFLKADIVGARHRLASMDIRTGIPQLKPLTRPALISSTRFLSFRNSPFGLFLRIEVDVRFLQMPVSLLLSRIVAVSGYRPCWISSPTVCAAMSRMRQVTTRAAAIWAWSEGVDPG
jgi:hypothetical protein